MTKFLLQNILRRSVTMVVLLLLLFGSSFAQITPGANGIVYVNKNVAGGDQSGNSWTNAVTELADALKAAKTNSSIQQIWVARGTYTPMYSAGSDGMNPYLQFGVPAGTFNIFLLVNNVKLFGGFQNANETHIDQRDTVNNNTVLSGNNSAIHVVMSVGAVGTAEINGFTIRDGLTFPTQTLYVNGIATNGRFGGGMYIESSAPAINNCIISNNQGFHGGGIYAYNATVSIRNSKINNNVCVGNGGAGQGAGIYALNCGSINIDNSTINNNSIDHSTVNNVSGGGVWAHRNNGSMSINISNSEISSNSLVAEGVEGSAAFTCSGSGAGIYAGVEANNIGTLTISNTVINNNSISLSTIAGSTAAVWTYGGGGGIASNCATTINNCIISNNNLSALSPNSRVEDQNIGGGIWISNPSFTINNSVMEGNAVTGDCEPSGGGIAYVNTGYNSATLMVNNCVMRNNISGGSGGAIYNANGVTSRIKNSLFVNNTASRGDALSNVGRSGILSRLRLINCTVYDNASADANGFEAIYNTDSSTTTVHNSILWSAHVNNLFDQGTSATYSIIKSNTVLPGVGNLNIDPQFMNAATGDLSLQPASPAANAGSNAAYGPAGDINNDTDLIGHPRLYENVIDMGAFELQTKAVDTTTSIASAERRANKLNVYPNPLAAGATLTIHSGHSSAELTGATLRLSDLSGHVLRQVGVYGPIQELTMPDVAGMYLITLLMRDDTVITTPVTVK